MGFNLSYAAEADVPEAVKAVYIQKGDQMGRRHRWGDPSDRV